MENLIILKKINDKENLQEYLAGFLLKSLK